MKQLQALALTLLLGTSVSANALSDSYYSQSIDIDFALAEDEESLKMALERIINRLFAFIDPIGDNSISIQLDYYTNMQRELED